MTYLQRGAIQAASTKLSNSFVIWQLGMHHPRLPVTEISARAQVWDLLSGKLKKDLQYQADEQFMMHDVAVLALSFTRDSELLVSGSQDGKIKVITEYFSLSSWL